MYNTADVWVKGGRGWNTMRRHVCNCLSDPNLSLQECVPKRSSGSRFLYIQVCLLTQLTVRYDYQLSCLRSLCVFFFRPWGLCMYLTRRDCHDPFIFGLWTHRRNFSIKSNEWKVCEHNYLSAIAAKGTVMACLQWQMTSPIIKWRQPLNLCLPAPPAQHQNWRAASKKRNANCRFQKWSEELHVHWLVPSKGFINDYYSKMLLQNLLTYLLNIKDHCTHQSAESSLSSECRMGFALAWLNTQHLHFGTGESS